MKMKSGRLLGVLVAGVLAAGLAVLAADWQGRLVQAEGRAHTAWLDAYRAGGATVRYVAKSGSDAGSCASPASPCLTIQYAVDQADAGDEIRIAAGTYSDMNMVSGTAQIAYIDKSLILQGGFSESDWTVSDPESNLTVIDGQFSGRGLFIEDAENIVVTGLQIIHAHYDDPFDDDRGGGIHVENSFIVISDTIIHDNDVAFIGGGVSLYQSTAIVQNNVITDNYGPGGAGGNGGAGIHASQTFLVAIGNLIQGNSGGGISCIASSCSFYLNTFLDNSAAEGAGVHLDDVEEPVFYGNIFEGNRSGDFGGGVYLEESANALIESNIFIDNWAFTSNSPFADDEGDGGAIYVSPTSSALVLLNVIGQNKAANGGGIYMYSWNGGSIITENDIYSNTASDGEGGGIRTYSDVLVENNNVYGNLADLGGGIYLDGTGCRVNNNQVTGNQALFYGGGIYDACVSYVDGNVIRNNLALSGGGAYFKGTVSASSLWTNNIVAQNQATEHGSGILVYQTSPHFVHNTIAANSNGDGSGIFLQSSFMFSPLVMMTNTVIVSQTVGVMTIPEEGLHDIHLEATLWGADGWENGLDWLGAGSVMTGTINLWGNPLFVDPAAGNFHISSGSPAFDAGIASGITADIDGDARPFWEGVDIGADELLDFSLLGNHIHLPVIFRED